MKTKELIIFFALTIALSYAAYLLPIPRPLVLVVMVIIPTLVALPLVRLTEGRAAFAALLKQVMAWKIGLHWLAVSIGLGFLLRFAVTLLALAQGQITEVQVRPWNPVQMVGFAVALYVFAMLEEIGWRGYVLPRLLVRFSPLAAGLIIGIGWGVIHLALHLPGMDLDGLPPAATLLQLVSASIFLTWLYLQRWGSVVPVSLLHMSQSFFVIVNDGIAPDQQFLLYTVVYVAAALGLALFSRTLRQVDNPLRRAVLRPLVK